MRKSSSTLVPSLTSFATATVLTLTLGACTTSKSIPLQPASSPNANQGSTQPASTATPTPTPGGRGAGGGGHLGPGDQETVARIYCEEPHDDSNTGYPGFSFNTMPADADPSFPMGNVQFFNADGTQAVGVKSPVPLLSSQTTGAATAHLVLQACQGSVQDPHECDSWKIYKSTIDMLAYKGDLELISNYGATINEFDLAYQQLHLTRRLIAANSKKTAIVYPNDRGIYVVERLNGGGKTTLGLSAGSYSNPVFVGQDQWVKFDELTAHGMTQKLISINGQHSVNLPAGSGSQLFAYVDAQNIIYWVEGSATSSWSLRSMGLHGGHAAGSMRLPGDAHGLVLPVAFYEKQGQTFLAYAEEVKNQQQNSLTTAVMHVISASSRAQAQAVAYPNYLTNVPFANVTGDSNILRWMFYEPLSGQIMAADAAVGGLISFDPVSGQWQQHGNGMNGIFRCINPDWGIEVIHE